MSAAEPPAGGAGPGSYPAIIVRGDVLDRLRTSPIDDGGSVGVLIGNAAPSTNFVLVTAHLEADPADPGSSTFGPVQIDLLTRLVASVYPGQRIVGWYRLRAGGGVFLTAEDIGLQQTSFSHTWHIGYVHDVSGDEGAFFGWLNGEIVRVPRWEVTSVETASGAGLPVALQVDEPSAGDLDTYHDDGEPAIEEPAWAMDPAPETGVDADDDADADADADLPESPEWAPAPVEALASDADVPSAELESLEASPPPAPSKKRPNRALIAVVIAAVAAIVITALALSSGDDDDGGTAASSTDLSIPATDPADSSTSVDETAAPSSSVESTTTTAAPSSSGAPGTDAPPVSIDLPATPTVPTAAAARVGQAAAPCEETGDSEYAPIADCHIALPNGNVLLFVQGSLRCTEPSGRVLANEAQAFTVGAGGDPLAIIADGALVPKCSDVTFARNLLAGGAATLDGLCGSSGTQINEATARCFGYNGQTGAMGSIARGIGNVNSLVASCVPSTGDVVRSDLDWSNPDVSTLWRVDSVTLDAATGQLVASASRNGDDCHGIICMCVMGPAGSR